MSVPSVPRDPDELAQLRAELAAQRTTIAAQQAAVDALRGELHRHTAPAAPRPRRLPRRFLPLALVALLVVLTPLATFAANPFTDLTGGVHDPNIGLIYDAGITRGCVPNVSYCPTGNVTREEMASFLARTAGLGTNPPVANAKTAQTAALATNATNAQTATNAVNAVNAQTATNATHAASADTATNATNAVNAQTATNATNATTVDGYAPNGLVRVARGASTAVFPAVYSPTATSVFPTFETLPGTTATLTAPGDGFVIVSATVEGVNTTTTEAASVRLRNTTAGAPPTNVSPFVYSGFGAANSYHAISTQWVFPVAGAGAKSFTLEVSQSNATVGDVYFSNGAITAIFVPFGSGGAATLGGADAPTAPSTGPLQLP